MPITLNEIAVVKITGEEVWVLRSAEEVEAGALWVRRPTQTNDGVKHLVETFLESELESVEDNSIRRRNRQAKERNEQLADQAELQQKILQLKPKYSFETKDSFDSMQ